ncbi:MAG: translation initiation factor IF-2 [Pseudomonadota bacterium]
MSKIRIYELAKELDMDNKQLLAQVKEMGYDVKNHMSALEEADAKRVKEIIMGVRSEVVVDERIRPNVIRRRTKVLHTEPPPTPPARVPEVKPEAEPRVAGEEAPQPVVAGSVVPIEERMAEVAEVHPESEKLPERIEEKVVRAQPERPTEVPVAAAESASSVQEVQAHQVRPARKEYVRIIRKPAPVEPVKPAEREERQPIKGLVHAGPAAKEQTRAEPAASPKEEKDTKKKYGKKLVEFVPDFAAQRKKSTQRRKEVIERAQLYELTKGEVRPLRARKGEKVVAKKKKGPEITVPKQIKRRVKVDGTIMVGELAKRMGVKGSEVIKKLMQLGVIVTVNKVIDFEAAALVGNEFGYEVEKAFFEETDLLQARDTQKGRLMPRPPVVTIMGHVDHGKTSLLDAIRHTNVTAGEAGGITQHIGAYHVTINSQEVVFLDTPGHEAFTAMRARGAKVTDIVILVVAADDGVMEQTKEAINHARAADVHIVVAINKIDKPNANPERVRRELADLGLLSEEWGGQTIMAEVSAKQKKGINELLELILLQAEVLELKASPEIPARGRIIEARIDTGRGPVGSVLVQEGTLKQGDPFVCGPYGGKVRAMFDDNGNRVVTAGPSMPVLVQGFSGIPMAGDEFIVVEDEKKARQVSSLRQLKLRESELSQAGKISLERLFEKMKEGEVKELKLIVKTDVQGSLEALVDSLVKLSTAGIKVNIIHGSTGTITETDIMLASASTAIIIGFNVRPAPRVQELAEQEKVDVRTYDVIYQVIDDIRDAMSGLLEPVFEEKVIGRAEIRETFNVSKVGTIAGSFVVSGKMERGAKARLIRDGAVVHNGRVGSLKRFKEDAKEVQAGYECGIGLEKFNDIKVGDVVESYVLEEVKPTL